jgi:hypothetical protein
MKSFQRNIIFGIFATSLFIIVGCSTSGTQQANVHDHVALVLGNTTTQKDKEILSIQNKSLPIQKKDIIFEDYFDNEANKWSLLDTVIADIEIKDGKYIINHKINEGLYDAWHSLNLNEYMDFVIEASVEKIEGSISAGYGLYWGSYEDMSFGYKISDKDQYSIVKMKNDSATNIVPWKKLKTAENPALTKKLKIIKQGNSASFYVNDEYLVKVPNLFSNCNEVGFIVEGNTKIAVDYIRITKTTPENVSVHKKSPENPLQTK